MARQSLALRNNDDVVIDSPAGFITIHRRGQHVELNMPEGIKAYVGKDRAVKESLYVENVMGRLVPKWKVLVPMVDLGGSLVGIMPPQVLTLGRRPAPVPVGDNGHERNDGSDSLADVASGDGGGLVTSG